jgi:adenylate kinase
MNIIFLGFPGSGKSTQGKLLSEKLGIPWVSIGLLLREEFRKGTPDGIEANKYQSQGINCPTEIKARILEKILTASVNGFVLDNYPRTRDDLDHLKIWLNKTNRRIDKVFLLKTSENEVIERLLKQEQLDHTGAVRNDTSAKSIKKRIKIGFLKDADVIMDYFRKIGALIEINGEQSVEKVHEETMSKIK